MNFEAFLILNIPLVGLVAICKDGKWNWRVIESGKLLNAIFWIGWFGGLFYGTLRLFGVIGPSGV